MTLLLPLPALAQASAPCGGAPCMQIGREDPDNGNVIADDADHFVYCPEGETVQVEIIARPAIIPCNDCEHAARTVTWTVSGATSHTVVDASASMAFNQTEINATILLGDAGDTVTITCTVAEASTDENDCAEDRHGNAEHSGNHGQASASCTIKLWRLDMEVGETNEDPEEDPIPIDPTSPNGTIYQSEFAKSVTTSAILIGATPAAASGGIHPWTWESYVDGNTSPHAMRLDTPSWAGKMVAETLIEVTAVVTNGCDSTKKKSAKSEVWIDPTFRRPGWITPTYSNIPNETMFQTVPSQFPRTTNGILWGLNTNSNNDFETTLLATEVVTPIYHDSDSFPFYFGAFDDVVEEIPSGPNAELWFNSDNSLYCCDRVAKINHWITSGAGKPSDIPNTGPPGSGITSFSNFHDLHVQMNDDKCGCSNPSAHDGVGGNYRYLSTLWHETIGCPASDNQPILGHHELMTNAILNDSELNDPVYQADLLWAESKEQLRAYDAAIQVYTSEDLADAMEWLHNTVSSHVQLHNFFGKNWLFSGGTSWSYDACRYNGGW